jgi:hypothetical protein
MIRSPGTRLWRSRSLVKGIVMRKTFLIIAMAGFVGSAAAGEIDRGDSFHDGNDYSAKAYYRLDFGGTRAPTQGVGLRFENELARSHGAPAVIDFNLNSNAGASARLYGVELRGSTLTAGAAPGGFFSSLTGAQWAGLALTAVVFGTVISSATNKDDVPDSTSGSGS